MKKIISSLLIFITLAVLTFSKVTAIAIPGDDIIYLPFITKSEDTPPPPTIPGDKNPKGDGWYVVNSEIAPGYWRSTAGSLSCYWERDKDLNQNLDSILGNYFGDSGGLIHILPTDVVVEFTRCGTWTYLPPDYQKVLQPNATSPHGDGVYLVGIDIAPGTWRTTSGNSNCYWERDQDATGTLDDIINNYYGPSGGFVTIAPTDLQLQISDCGTLNYISP